MYYIINSFLFIVVYTLGYRLFQERHEAAWRKKPLKDRLLVERLRGVTRGAHAHRRGLP